jgi:CO/xanthine dehydrogenase FAD-binding subunit
MMKDFEYFEPATLSEASSLLSRYKGEAKVIAGGTDLLVGMKQGIINPRYLINIKKIPHLNHIDYDEKKGFSIGALTTLHAVETSLRIREKIRLLAEAAHRVGVTRIRNIGTIGGNLCQDSKCLYYARTHLWRWAPCYRGGGDVCYAVDGAKRCQAMATAETAPALLCLGAKVKVTGLKGERAVAIDDFFGSAGETNLGADAILTEIRSAKVRVKGWGLQ